MAQDLESAGIPTAFISALPEIPVAMGVNRVIPGVAITHLLGDPRRSPEEERRLRKAVVRTAINSLRVAPERPTLFPISLEETALPQDMDRRRLTEAPSSQS